MLSLGNNSITDRKKKKKETGCLEALERFRKLLEKRV